MLAISVSPFVVTAQNKLLTLDDIFSTDPKVRVQFDGNPAELEWARDGKSFKQIREGKLMRVDAMTGEAAPFFDAVKFISAVSRESISVQDAQAVIDSDEMKFNGTDTAFIFTTGSDLWYYEIASATAKRLTSSYDEEKEADFSPDGRWVSFVRGNNLFVVDIATGGEKQLNRDGREGPKAIYNGYLDWIYEEELYGRGDKRGYWWSPDSLYIAFLRLDESPVPKFVIADDIPTGQKLEVTDYPKAGEPNPLVRLGVVKVNSPSRPPKGPHVSRATGKRPGTNSQTGNLVRFVDVGEYKPDDLLIVRVAWSPDGRAVVFQTQNREQTILDLNAATVDGKMKRLFRETSPAWVGLNGNPFFLKDGTAIWQSERDGWNHLYHYANDGNLIKRITEGKWEVRSVYGVDEANGWIYFAAIKDSPIEENVYRVKIDGGDVQRITQGEGWHSASFNSTFTQFVDTWSDVNTPPQQRLYQADGKLIRVIDENKVDALNNYKLGATDFLRVKTQDGYEMEAMMIRPPDFNPNKKYPVLSYTYSGPHAPSVENQWGGSMYMWHQMMAQKGYVIWICDNRTASGKGLESTWAVYKNFGSSELQDLEDGFSYLKSLSFIDGERIGMWGWSYGGFMTSYAMTHSKTLKVGIAGGTVTDWRNYDSIYTERYMLTPDHNREGYDRSAVQKAAKDLSGRLLLIQGMTDNNVHMQSTTQFVYELQKAGKQFDLMLYPTQRHVVDDPAQEKHLYSTMTEFILKNL